ncbi:MAG: Na+/H+ antiporter NhaC family protein [Bacteroidaceae bacterium]|nr:Na+/H+ antiporter NhaC family protein [Bacteroidaceae bacterium]
MKINKRGLLGISPLIFFLLFFVVAALIGGDFAKVPVTVVFFFSSIYAVSITRGLSLPDRVRVFGRGAGTTKMMFIVWIILCAGGFASSAEAMGCIKETVDCILMFLPSQYIFASIFIAGCFISMATGSGLGSIVAVGPIAVGVAHSTGADMALMCAIVVCGAMFGDNLSFISDTTIIATNTQGCQLKDKFMVNIWMALPAAIVTIILYLVMGKSMAASPVTDSVNYIKIIPYISVIAMAVLGVDVLVLLLVGTLMCGVMGMCYGDFDFFGWMAAIEKGMLGMGSLVIIILLAAGLMALIEHNGGLEYITRKCQTLIRGRRSAEAVIVLLAAIACICTAMNTIAIIAVAPTAKNISERYGIDPRKTASLMDTSTCIVEELIPYSLHLLPAAALGGITATSLIPYVYYTYALLFFLILSIIFNIPRLKPLARKDMKE